MKKCFKCGETKGFDEFYPHRMMALSNHATGQSRLHFGAGTKDQALLEEARFWIQEEESQR